LKDVSHHVESVLNFITLLAAIQFKI